MPGSPILVRLRNRTERLRQRSWRLAAYESPARHIIIGGAPRSGTTLLRRLFDHHPGICAGPETKLFIPAAFNLEWLSIAFDIPFEELVDMRRRSGSQAAFIDAFAVRVTHRSHKPRWAEKTPMNIQYLEWITQHFPRASIVHIVRDGRDVLCSMRRHPDWRWRDGAWEKVLVARPLESYARRWLADTARGMRWRGDPRYVEVRYEDIVADPSAELRRVCAAIDESPDEGWLQAVSRPVAAAEAHVRPDDKGAVSAASVGRWREDLDADELATVTRLLGSRLRELGYEA